MMEPFPSTPKTAFDMETGKSLPTEIIIQIIQDYFAFRDRELRGLCSLIENRDPSSLRSANLEDAWLALPLLQTCKYFCEVGQKILYKDIILLDIPDTLLKLVRDPHPQCLLYIRTLDIRHAEYESSPSLTLAIEDRVLQSQGLGFVHCATAFDWKTSLVGVQQFVKNWKDELRPRLSTIKVSNDGVVLVSWLSSLFRVDEIALYGWRSNDNLPSTLGFNDNLRITLHIHPFMQPGWADIDTVARQNDASLIITLAIGWYEASDSTMPGVVDDQSKDRWALAAVHSLMRLDTLGELDNKIKFTPHLEDGEHRFCFPTQKPQDIIDADYPHSPIGFHSPCNCGMGDLTGIWEAIEATIRIWMQDRPNSLGPW